MTKSDAERIVSNCWTCSQPDSRLNVALAVLGISPEQFRKLKNEVRRVTKGHNRLQILTPSGMGRRT